MTPRDRRALIAGAAVLALAGGFRLTTAARAGLRERVHELEQAHALLARSEDLVARAPGLSDRLAARNARLVALAPLLLDGASVPEAVANLSALVSGWAAAAGLAVRQIVPPLGDSGRAGGPFAPVSLLVRAHGDLEGLARLLDALERGPQLVDVERLAVDVEPGAEASQTLAIELVLSGWVLVWGGA